MATTKKEVLHEQISLFLIIITILTFLVVIGILAIEVRYLDNLDNIEIQLKPEQECFDGSIDQLMEQIEKDCGDTFITKKYGEDDWFVFLNDCDSRGYCKSIYVKLEDCLTITTICKEK